MDAVENRLNRDVASLIYKICFDNVLEELKYHKKIGIAKWNDPSVNLMMMSSKDTGAIQHPYHEFNEFIEDHMLYFPQGHNCSNCMTHMFPCLNCDAFLYKGNIPGQLWNIDWDQKN